MTCNPPQNDRSSTTRRRALAAAGLTTATSLSGCLGALTGNNDTPTPSRSFPTYTDWAYPQGEGDIDGYRIVRFDLETMRGSDVTRDALLRHARDLMDDIAYLGKLGSMSDVETFYTVENSHIFQGPWEKTALEDAVSAFSNVESIGSKHGYSLYTDTRNPGALAVGDGVFVAAHKSAAGQPDEVAKLLVDVKAGEKERFVKTSEDFATVMEPTGGGYYSAGYIHEPWRETRINTGDIKGVTAKGKTLSIEDGRIKRHVLLLYADADQANRSDVEELAQKYYVLEDPTVTKESDRLFTITGLLAR